MNDTTPHTDDANEESGLTIVAVSAEHTQAVLDFLATLDRDETDVSGYMSSGGLIAAAGGKMKRLSVYSTDTGCLPVVTGILSPDFTCSDTDTEIS